MFQLLLPFALAGLAAKEGLNIANLYYDLKKAKRESDEQPLFSQALKNIEQAQNIEGINKAFYDTSVTGNNILLLDEARKKRNEYLKGLQKEKALSETLANAGKSYTGFDLSPYASIDAPSQITLGGNRDISTNPKYGLGDIKEVSKPAMTKREMYNSLVSIMPTQTEDINRIVEANYPKIQTEVIGGENNKLLINKETGETISRYNLSRNLNDILQEYKAKKEMDNQFASPNLHYYTGIDNGKAIEKMYNPKTNEDIKIAPAYREPKTPTDYDRYVEPYLVNNLIGDANRANLTGIANDLKERIKTNRKVSVAEYNRVMDLIKQNMENRTKTRYIRDPITGEVIGMEKVNDKELGNSNTNQEPDFLKYLK